MTRDLGFVRRSIALYLNNHDPRDPHVSPIFGDLRNLPPTLVQVGSAEMFIDDARALATAAQAAGWSFSYQEVPRMWTSWFLFLPYVPQALQTLREVGAFIRQHVP
jgi:epsilon-lactone hydrolase